MKDKLLYPFKILKKQYLALLSVYFSVGLVSLTSVSSTFFFREHISLNPAELTSVMIFAALPWSIKMLFGSIIDSFTLFGNNRKNYIYLGNFLVFLGVLGLIDHGSTQYIFSYLGQYFGLILTNITITTGAVISDIIADTMAIEIAESDKEKAEIQVLIRLATCIGAVIGASVTGLLASTFPYYIVQSISLVIPLIGTIGTTLTKYNKNVPSLPLNKKVFTGGILFGIISILSSIISRDYGAVIMFSGASLILFFMFRNILVDIVNKKSFILAMLALFLFRLTPSYGFGIGWYYIDVLNFDQMFFGKISLIGSIVGLCTVWFLTEIVSKGNIFKTILTLTILGTLISIPDILIYYGLNPIAPKYLVMFDSAMTSPIVNLVMIPLGYIIAKNAPEKNLATYTTVTAGLMNLALVGGDVIDIILAKIFPVVRGDYSNLGHIMLYALTISTIFSIIGLILLKRAKS